jgi:hypothetical protein
MNQTSVLFDLEHNRKRLDYYAQLKGRLASTAPGAKAPKSPKALEKWIEIYEERVQKLERQASRLGLKTQLENLRASSQGKRAN